MRDVFIAHVEEDADITLEIALVLEEVGYTIWCYEIDSIPGLSYLIQTGRAVEESKVVVLIVSPHSLGSRQVTREVVRAHESDKAFIPVLRDTTHVEFQNRQPEWREAIGAATSISIPREGVAGIIPRIIDGLKSLGIHPSSKTEPARIAQIRTAIDGLRPPEITEKDKGQQSLIKEVVRPIKVEKGTTKSAWFWAGISLLTISFLGVGYDIALPFVSTDPESYMAVLVVMTIVFTLPFLIPGIYCTRRWIVQHHSIKSRKEDISNWWWLLPTTLGLVGGIISWVKQKDTDWRKAMNMLTLGIVTTLVWAFLFSIVQAP